MLKVLVADEDVKSNSSCCKFLANDKRLDIISVHSGSSTISKYLEIKPNILIINSNFKDKSYIDIINELSSTREERLNCNIILTVENQYEKLDLDFMAKIYKLLYLPVENSKIKNVIDQYNLDNIIFYEPTICNLNGLFYKLHLYNEHLGCDYLKYAIISCYNNPKLLNSLKNIFYLISKEFNVSYNSIRPAIRNALRPLNIYRNSIKNKGFIRLFENENSITPKNFIRIITNHYLSYKKNVR